MATPLNYLQLAQRLRLEVGANGTGPDSVLGQSGEYGRIVAWIATADEEVQRRHDNWRFMVGDIAINTVAGVGAYLPAAAIVPVTDLRTWKDRTIKCYLLSAGVSDERLLEYIDYDDWYAIYNTATQMPGQPVHYTIDNNLGILLGPAPNAVYRITAKYQRTVTTLTGNLATPVYPAEFHMLPVYAAMLDYGRFTGAPEVYQSGNLKYNIMLRQMERSQLPRLNRLIPLA